MSKDVIFKIGGRFGKSIFLIEDGKVDNDFAKKAIENKIGKQAVFATVKAINVNSLRTMDIPGGVKAIIVNGGENELKFVPGRDRFIESFGEYEQLASGSNAVFGKYENACEIANAVNIAEKARLLTIIDELKKEVSFLDDVISANDRVTKSYSEEG